MGETAGVESKLVSSKSLIVSSGLFGEGWRSLTGAKVGDTREFAGGEAGVVGLDWFSSIGILSSKEESEALSPSAKACCEEDFGGECGGDASSSSSKSLPAAGSVGCFTSGSIMS